VPVVAFFDNKSQPTILAIALLKIHMFSEALATKIQLSKILEMPARPKTKTRAHFFTQ
jgi:hypothetical protein